MFQEIYVAVGLVTFVYFLLKKRRQRQTVVEITPLQPPDLFSPMSLCSDSDEELLDVTPHIQDDYMELYQKQGSDPASR
jgi:hypothetical protein